MKLRTIALAAAAVFALGFGQVLAQYPPPVGNIAIQPANPNPGVNTDAALTVTVQSEAGVAAANVACIATVASQPGSDASVSPANFTTDAAGKATLMVHTGSSSGQIQVAIGCGGLSASATLFVGASAPLPPDTGAGVGPAEGANGFGLVWIIAAASTAAAACVVAVRKRIHAS